MSHQMHIKHLYVEYIPEHLEPGLLYISKRFRTASHLCCCGCGLKVVTPLNPAKWRLIDHGDSVSLTPSIGNWNYPCRSHYLIVQGTIQWASQLSLQLIAAVKGRDHADVQRYAGRRGVLSQFIDAFKRWFG